MVVCVHWIDVYYCLRLSLCMRVCARPRAMRVHVFKLTVSHENVQDMRQLKFDGLMLIKTVARGNILMYN